MRGQGAVQWGPGGTGGAYGDISLGVKYQVRLVFVLMYKRSLYFRPEWPTVDNLPHPGQIDHDLYIYLSIYRSY